MTLTLRFAAHSDRGLIRDGNQDSVFAGPRLLAVADGMGGMAAGDVASNIVIGTLAPLDDDVPGSDLVDVLRNAVSEANQRLRATVAANPQMEGMGTTLTALLFSGTRFGLIHVGDSRCYLLRDGQYAQITKDDSYVQMLVDEGRITPEEATNHPQRSLITRALQGEDVEPEFSVREAHAGDRYLVCSDGLHGFVSDETISETIRSIPDTQECVDRLIQLALRAGGPDNVTVIIADVVEGVFPEQSPIVGGAAAQDRGNVTVADPNSPAARAALAQQPPRPPAPPEPTEPDDADARRRHPVRNSLIVLAVLVVLAGGGFGVWRYTQAQYFVGATDDGYVAVFRGVPGKVVGLQLSTVDVKSDTKTSELTQLVRNRVTQGIDSPNRTSALNTLRELTDDSTGNPNMLPVCETPTPTPSSTPSASRSPKPTGSAASKSAKPSHPASKSPSPTPSPVPSGACRPAR
ncbi:PP2C family protein-serine/threonine phosphatase [Actinocatenispora comari]|jgi:protein phosphatase|uniref:Serine/threonine protein phosphatase PstP n=1 Tax=Actinocatenispora comari TaxID=2807577 RepID=A0A8J4A5W2_9ACTN|nr:PP2C family serine/threonine-protein phosphatase [Actinocatenispora comari]GIL24838.1 protein phosphatase [Actinocatenispora comari]